MMGSGERRMIESYERLLRRFIDGEITPDQFENDYLTAFKSDQNQALGASFDILDELFADVDAYVADPRLRGLTGGLSGDEMRVRARSAYIRLFG